MIRKLGRVTAAAVLVLSTVAVAAVVPSSSAGAANTAVTMNCPASGMDFSPQTIGFNDTVTLTVGTNCASAKALPGGSGSWVGSVLLMGAVMVPTAAYYVSPGDVIVYTAPASGANDAYILLSPSASPATAQVGINFPIPTGSMADNGDGTMTVTYTGWARLYLLASGSTCPSTLTGSPQNYLYQLTGDANAPSNMQLGSSPSVISAGRGAATSAGPNGTIAAGAYQACLYAGSNLLQSLAASIGVVAPTTTTTAPADDPVIPAFTG